MSYDTISGYVCVNRHVIFIYIGVQCTSLFFQNSRYCEPLNNAGVQAPTTSAVENSRTT